VRRGVRVGSGNDLDRLRQRGLHLVYATVAWNAVEGVTALVAGLLAHSVALTAFGLDSSIEVFVSLVAVWQMKAETRFRSRVALRLIGVSFLAVSLYVGFEAIRRLASGQHAELSMIGLAVTSAAVPTMAVLGFAKRRVASRVGNAVLAAEARFSLVDACLSAAVLLGLVMDHTLGWWWADPVVALVIACGAAREGIEHVRSSRRSISLFILILVVAVGVVQGLPWGGVVYAGPLQAMIPERQAVSDPSLLESERSAEKNRETDSTLRRTGPKTLLESIFGMKEAAKDREEAEE
jgi:hypothetical protein